MCVLKKKSKAKADCRRDQKDSCASASHGNHLKGEEGGGRGVRQSHCLAQREKHFALLDFKVIMRKNNFQFAVKLLCTHLPDYWWETVGYFAVMWNFQLSPRAEGVFAHHSQSACESSNITDLQETVDWGFVDACVCIFANTDFSLRFGLFIHMQTCKCDLIS